MASVQSSLVWGGDIRTGVVEQGVLLNPVVIPLSYHDEILLNQRLNHLLSDHCANESGECILSDNVSGFFRQQSHEGHRTVYLSLRQPEALLFYHSHVLPLMADRVEDPVLQAFQFIQKDTIRHCKKLDDELSEMGGLEAWFKRVSNLRAYLPLLVALGRDLRTLSDYLGRHIPTDEAADMNSYLLTHERNAPFRLKNGSSYSEALPEILLTRAANSAQWLRVPGFLKLDTSNNQRLGFDVEDHQKLSDYDVTELIHFILYKRFLAPQIDTVPPVFIGYIPPVFARIFIKGGAYYDENIPGGNIVHGYFSHILQLAQLNFSGASGGSLMEQMKAESMTNDCWNRLFDRAAQYFWKAGFGLELSNGDKVVFFDLPVGFAADPLQQMLSTRYFSELLDRAVKSSDRNFQSLVLSELGLNNVDELIEARRSVHVIETAVIAHDLASWQFLIDAGTYFWPASLLMTPYLELSDEVLHGQKFVQDSVMESASELMRLKLIEKGYSVEKVSMNLDAFIAIPPPWPAHWERAFSESTQ
ncbi:MAG: hypothetical protein ACR2PX_12360 [Endozoicomonas sp.]|uniref:hypothetical protein n=1 Tax=Endozoicomonas sp. TaxID=1892382 RepID=UPI003D9B4692